MSNKAAMPNNIGCLNGRAWLCNLQLSGWRTTLYIAGTLLFAHVQDCVYGSVVFIWCSGISVFFNFPYYLIALCYVGDKQCLFMIHRSVTAI